MKRLLIIFLILLPVLVFGQGEPMLGEQIDWSHPLFEGLVGFWLMNEGSGNKVFDLSGHGHTGTPLTTFLWTSSKFGSALSSVDIGRAVVISYTRSNRNLSFVCWCKDVPSESGGVFSHNKDNPYEEFLFSINQSGKIYCFIGDGSNYDTVTSVSGLGFTGWHQYAVTISDTIGRVYYDGVDVTSGTGASTKSTTFTVRLAQTAYKTFRGILDYSLLYDGVLSASEIAKLYREPFCMFQKDDIELMAKVAEAPPTGVPTLYYYSRFAPLPLIFIAFYFMTGRKNAA